MSNSSTQVRWPIGVSIALVGSLLGALGDNFVRKSFIKMKQQLIDEKKDLKLSSTENNNNDFHQRMKHNKNLVICDDTNETIDIDKNSNKVIKVKKDKNLTIKNQPNIKQMIKNPLWIIGIVLAAGADTVATLAALVFAPATLITPFAGMHIFWSMLIARFWLKERIGIIEWVGAILIVSGITCVVVFAGKTDSFSTVGQFAPMLQQGSAIGYIIVNISLLIIFPLFTFDFTVIPTSKFIYRNTLYIHAMLTKLNRYIKKIANNKCKRTNSHFSQLFTKKTIMKNDNLVCLSIKPSSPISNIEMDTKESELNLSMSNINLQIEHEISLPLSSDFEDINKIKKLIIALESFCLSASSGLFGANTNLAAKLFTLYINLLFSGEFQFFKTWQFYVITIITLTFALFQLFFLNKALSKFEAIYVVPITNSFLIAASAIGGIFVFHEFPNNIIGFSFGLIGIIIGVLLLSIFNSRVSTNNIETKTNQTQSSLTSIEFGILSLSSMDKNKKQINKNIVEDNTTVESG